MFPARRAPKAARQRARGGGDGVETDPEFNEPQHAGDSDDAMQGFQTAVATLAPGIAETSL